jgi:signal transduction histidine kinase
VSHELKTPLSSIKVLTESILLQENVPSEVYREFLEDINSEIDRMTAIVNDLLSLVKLDYNGAKLNIAETDMNRLLRDIIKRLKPLADNKNIDLSFEAAKEVNVDADEVKLSLAISNLVENGIKYTPMDGKVKVSVDADHQNCYITVQDTGIGISEQEQSKIFDRFYRVDKTRDRETGGTGLGLAITHSTVMLHNGTVQIISGEGEGATFIVSLPLKYQQG